MRQVVQHARTGEISVKEVPAPPLLPNCAIVRPAAALISAGTERASSEFARKNLAQKAQARPDLVSDVLNKVRRDGLTSTISAVRNRLDQPGVPGYSSAGTIVAVGPGINDLRPGDRVACAGAGFAVHAELVSVPRLLLAQLPDASKVSFEDASFTTVGAVVLHAVRLSEAALGEVVAVIGLGLLGQLAVQVLKAAGCRVLGFDINPQRVQLALQTGADAACASAADFRQLCTSLSRGQGVDSVLIAAETPSSAPVNLAAALARDRAIVVALGTVGMDIDRKLYYEKELDFRVSRSYGPGRYDAAYEQKGRDYPIGYVRWTETRNMDAFIELLGQGKVNLKPLITHRFPLERASSAYELITGRSEEPFLGVLITYADDVCLQQRTETASAATGRARKDGSLKVGLVGAGSFATATLIPAMQRADGVSLVGVCNATGVRSQHAAGKFGFRFSTTDENEILRNPDINTVVVTTRHHLHARQVIEALRAGKRVFCEKPLCLTTDDLADIVREEQASAAPFPKLTVGFNRRFAPLAIEMKKFLLTGEPLMMHYRVNAGYLPASHWTNDPEEGGGRILGEVCHFVDFLTFLAEAPPVEVQVTLLANPGQYSDDNLATTLRFSDGSVGTITYVANGDKAYSKERVEAFSGGAVAALEDFRRLELVRNGKRRVLSSRLKQDKGHAAEWQALAKAAHGGAGAPIPFPSIVASTLATLSICDSRSTGQAIAVDAAGFISSTLLSRNRD